jgi:hypothetical protein
MSFFLVPLQKKSMTETSLHRMFGKLTDPRINRKKRHLFIDLVILSVLAVLSGAESWDAIELFGRENLPFLKRFLRLPPIPNS